MTTVLNDRAIAIQVPADATKMNIRENLVPQKLQYFKGDHPIFDLIDLPKGNWQVLGKASELTEEQAKEIVELENVRYKGQTLRLYEHYSSPVEAYCNTAVESVHSLLRSKNVTIDNVIILVKQ